MTGPGGGLPARAARKAKPDIYSIAAHRGFADALVAGLIPRYAEPDLGLARLTLLLPSRRATRIMTEAFVRRSGSASGAGLLLPRMAVVGDLDLDETLGTLFDTLASGTAIPPAVDPTRRWLRLAAILREVEGAEDEVASEPGGGAMALRRAREIAATMDRLLVEDIAPEALIGERVLGIVGEQADHWKRATALFLRVHDRWLRELAERGEIDAPARRNLLFEQAARAWKAAPPAHPIVAAGITSVSPALARLLRVVADLPQGAVVLPDLDLNLDRDVWDALGVAGAPDEPDGPVFGRGDAATHPQYPLKLLLNRMGIARDEVRAWHRSGEGAASPARSRAISSLFLPPGASARWVDLSADQRRLAGVRLMESAHPGDEAQAIAILLRQALDSPGKRATLITPDRGLATRVVAHLRRWGIMADDSAGAPLPQAAAGRVLLLLAEIIAQDASPAPLIALVTHPLVAAGEGRAAWLDHARALDLRLRGPRPRPGLEPIRARLREGPVSAWWHGVAEVLAPLFVFDTESPLVTMIDALVAAASTLCGDGLWAGADGRALSGFVDDLRGAADAAGTRLDPRELAAVLRDAMDRIAVRPPWGGHPRIAIYGLIEARMSRADLTICGGLVEGVWPGSPPPDALLPPAVLRALGVPGAEFRIGLAAHDLSAALGAPEVVLSWAQRDENGPVIPSRFVLRVQAMLGETLSDHREAEAVRLARAIDDAPAAAPYPRPQPTPSAEQRRVEISVTGLDRLRGDPYQFYAASILRLRRLDAIDVEPSAAQRGEIAHAALHRWHGTGEQSGALAGIAADELDRISAHPLMRALWRPRLLAALDWVEVAVAKANGEGRRIIGSEVDGAMHIDGIRIHGRADRIDRHVDGTLAVVDYKTGKPPSNSQVEQGFALQLGLIGLIAQAGGFEGITGEPRAFEYWSLARKAGDEAFGYVTEPIQDGARKRTGFGRDDVLPQTERYLIEALDRWIVGDAPFTARLNPDLDDYNDYDQLMRLDEWIARLGERAA